MFYVFMTFAIYLTINKQVTLKTEAAAMTKPLVLLLESLNSLSVHSHKLW